MKTYPSIPTQFESNAQYHVFDKLDGSNIRAEWHRKAGFHRFGSRKQLLTQEHALAAAAAKIRQGFAESLGSIFQAQGYEQATCFFEYFGPNSFAGDHLDTADRMEAVLLDVSPHRKGMLPPETFLRLFGHLRTPNYLGERYLNPGFVEAVRGGTLAGVTAEGVVCKTILKNRLRMTKIKSLSWLRRLRADCRDESEFQRRA